VGKKRKQKFTQEEMIMFGKMCGCEKCKFCIAWQQERVWLSMVDEVEKGKERAKQAQLHIKEGWLWK
jgi:hypothetical protein